MNLASAVEHIAGLVQLFRKGKLVRSVPQAELGDALKDEIQKILREQQAEK